jgi:hypothetical protein
LQASLRRNSRGVYVLLTERRFDGRIHTILVPSIQITALVGHLTDCLRRAETGDFSPDPGTATGAGAQPQGSPRSASVPGVPFSKPHRTSPT